MNSNDKKRIRAIPGNEKCCDCSTSNPTWVSLSHGTLICMECSGRHRGLGVHISFVRSIDLDNFSELDLKKMDAGGNEMFKDFLVENGGASLMEDDDSKATTSIRERYESDAARLYREVLKARVDGRTEPTANDLFKQSESKSETRKQMTQDPSEVKGGVAKIQSMSSKSANKSQIFASSQTAPIPSAMQRFVGGFKYWIYRLVSLPLRNNRRLTVSLLTLYAMNKVASKAFASKEEGITNAILTISSKFFTTLIFSTTSSILALSCLSIHWFNVHRQAAFKSATNAFQDRTNNARAKRNPLYDLYFPPNVSIGSEVSKAVIFYPDVLVDKSAYATVMGKLSDAGILVAVVNLDPLRIPTQMEEAGGKPISSSTTVLKIAFEIQKLLGIQVEEWVLMSHGEGACAVTDIIRNAPAALQGSSGKLRKPRCVLWSPTSFLHDLSNVSASVLVVTTSDGAIDSGSVISKMLPRSSENRTMHYVIGGGSHSGFVHYGPGTFKKEKDNRTKSLDEQQKEVRDLTVDFILQREPSVGKKD